MAWKVLSPSVRGRPPTALVTVGRSGVVTWPHEVQERIGSLRVRLLFNPETRQLALSPTANNDPDAFVVQVTGEKVKRYTIWAARVLRAEGLVPDTAYRAGVEASDDPPGVVFQVGAADG